MTDHAWLLKGFWEPRIQIGFDCDDVIDTDFFRNFLRKMALQQQLTAEEVPKGFQLHRRTRESKLLRCPLTFNGPGLCVREDVADILRQFRLGRTSLFPVALTMGPEQAPAPCPQ